MQLQAAPSNNTVQAAEGQFNSQNYFFQAHQQKNFHRQGKTLLGQCFNETLDPDSPEYAEKLASLLRTVTVERRKGDLDHHVQQLSQASNFEQPFQLLRYVVYLSSNDLLDASRTDALLRWILDSSNFWVVQVLMALHTPTTDAFASALLNSAVRLGKNSIACELLQKDVNPNFKTINASGFPVTTLDEAMRARNTALVRQLVRKGAQKHSQSNSWEELLLSCSNSDYLRDVQFIIDNGVDADKRVLCYAQQHRLFVKVIENGNLAAAKMFLQAGVCVNKTPGCSATPLQAAAGCGNVEMVKLLIKAGADIDAPKVAGTNIDAPIDALYCDMLPTCSLLTPLQIALAQGKTAVAEVLMQHGADINGIDATPYCDAWKEKSATVEEFYPYRDEFDKSSINMNAQGRFWRQDPYSEYCRCREVGLLSSPLQAAASRGNLSLADRLLGLGANIHARGGFGTALQVAAGREGNLELVKLLLDKGAEINASANDLVGRTALQAAIQYGDLEIVHFLLESGADVDDVACLANGRTALQAAIYKNDVILAKLLILLGANVNAKASRFNGRTCLQAASEIGNIQMIDLLLKNGADANAPPSELSGGMTAIQAAVEGKHIIAAQRLLDHGADPNVINPGVEFHEYQYPLWDSIDTQQHKMTQLLLENGADPNNITGCENPLALAISMQELETVQLLIKYGADIHALSFPDCESMLQVAAAAGSLPLCRFLIEAGARWKGDWGTAALHSAIGNHQTVIIQFLLLEGVNPNWEYGPRTENSIGLCSPISETFLASCRIRSPRGNHKVMEEITELLLLHGANIDSKDQFGKEVCHVSLHQIQRLIEAGLDINHTPPILERETLLQYASGKGMIQVVQLLLTAGADVNRLPEKSKGCTALQGAIKGQHIRVAELLLSNGADVNGPPSESYGATALQMAVIVGSWPLVLLLLKKGADVNAAPSAKGGLTALEAAAEHGRLDIAYLLLKEDKEQSTLQTRCREAAELASSKGFPVLSNVLKEWKVQNATV